MNKEIIKDLKEAAKYPEDFVRFYDDDIIVLTRNGQQDPLFDFAMVDTGILHMKGEDTYFYGMFERDVREELISKLERSIAEIRKIHEAHS